ncbi:unnamed protein product, partial [Staurois parvus]
MSVPKAVTPSYTRAYHAALHRESCSAYHVLRSPAMCPLQRPRPSPLADAGIRLLCSGPCDVGTYGRRRQRENLSIFKKCHFFQNDFTYALSCPVCILTVLS